MNPLLAEVRLQLRDSRAEGGPQKALALLSSLLLSPHGIYSQELITSKVPDALVELIRQSPSAASAAINGCMCAEARDALVTALRQVGRLPSKKKHSERIQAWKHALSSTAVPTHGRPARIATSKSWSKPVEDLVPRPCPASETSNAGRREGTIPAGGALAIVPAPAPIASAPPPRL